jgi:YbgC/YbaW family acyl-CoA thioester hydrolase
MNRIPLVFRTRHRPPFHKLDPNGHMSTSAYLEFFLDHRFTGLREVVGLDLASLSKLPIIFVVRRASIDFQSPIYGDEEFEIESHVTAFGERDCEVRCEMRKGERSAATCELTLVCIAKESRKPVPWDPSLVARFYEEVNE